MKIKCASRYGKFAGVFFSTGGLAAGQETTALSCIPFFVHHGIRFVPLGYASKRMSELEIHGGGK